MKSQNQLANILKNARLKAKMTQVEVAEKAGIHPNYYARVERGEVNPTADIVDLLATALQVKVRFPLEESK